MTVPFSRPPGAILVLLLSFCLLPWQEVSAQAATPIDRTGFSIGARLYAVGIATEFEGEESDESGAGFEAEIAYGFTPSVALFLNLGGASINGEDGADDYTLGVADLGVRFNIMPSAKFNPFIRVALTGQVAAFDVPGTSEDLEASGGGFTLGLGFQYSMSSAVDLELGLDLTGGEFNELSFDGESTDNFDPIESGIAQIGIGVVFRL